MCLRVNTLRPTMVGIAAANEAKWAGWGDSRGGHGPEGSSGGLARRASVHMPGAFGEDGPGAPGNPRDPEGGRSSKAGDSPPLAPPSQGGERDGLLTSRRKSSSSRSPRSAKGGKGWVAHGVFRARHTDAIGGVLGTGWAMPGLLPLTVAPRRNLEDRRTKPICIMDVT